MTYSAADARNYSGIGSFTSRERASAAAAGAPVSGGAADRSHSVVVHSSSCQFSPSADSIRAFLTRHGGASGAASTTATAATATGSASPHPRASAVKSLASPSSGAMSARSTSGSSTTWAAAQVPVNLRTDRLLQQLAMAAAPAAATERSLRAQAKQRASEKRQQQSTDSAADGTAAAAATAAAASASAATASAAAPAIATPAPRPSIPPLAIGPKLKQQQPQQRDTVILVSADDEWQVEVTAQTHTRSERCASLRF